MTRFTYTFAIMEVSKETYEEIKRKMVEAGYDHVFHSHENGPVIDMVGIAIQAEEQKENRDDVIARLRKVNDDFVKQLSELMIEYEKLKEYKAAWEAKEGRSYHGSAGYLDGDL